MKGNEGTHERRNTARGKGSPPSFTNELHKMRVLPSSYYFVRLFEPVYKIGRAVAQFDAAHACAAHPAPLACRSSAPTPPAKHERSAGGLTIDPSAAVALRQHSEVERRRELLHDVKVRLRDVDVLARRSPRDVAPPNEERCADRNSR